MIYKRKKLGQALSASLVDEMTGERESLLGTDQCIPGFEPMHQSMTGAALTLTILHVYSLPQNMWHNAARGYSMKAANAQIGECLGVQPPATETEILRIVEGRLAPAIIKRLISLGLESGEIDAAIIPQRTLQHRRSRREKLTVEESDRVLRAIRVLSLAESVYGSREWALTWLRKPHARLDGRAPLSLLKTDTGSRIVEELLIQIDEGMFI